MYSCLKDFTWLAAGEVIQYKKGDEFKYSSLLEVKKALNLKLVKELAAKAKAEPKIEVPEVKLGIGL